MGLALFAGCASQERVIERSLEYREANNAFMAYEVLRLERLNRGDSVDEEFEKAYWRARRDWLIEAGRDEIFRDNEFKALGLLNQALALDPESVAALDLVDKAKDKLAVGFTRDGNNSRKQDDLDSALLHYARALEQRPEWRDALAGRALVDAEFQRRHEFAVKQLNFGLETEEKNRFTETKWHGSISVDKDPSLREAKLLRERAERELVEREFETASLLLEEGQYGAAFMVFENLLERKPDYPGAVERRDSAKREFDVEGLANDALMEIRRGNDFAKAHNILNKAFEMSVFEKARINELMAQAREQEAESKLRAAKNLELQNRYEEALVAYREIAADWPGGFQDVTTRISALEIDIDLALKAFTTGEEAEAAGDLEAAIEAYKEALLYHPGFKNPKAKLEALKVDGA